MGDFKGTGLLQRLQRYNLDVVPPAGGAGGSDQMITQIQRFRSAVYREFGSLTDDEDPSAASADHRAWHLVGYCGAAMVGCVRVLLFADGAVGDVPLQMVHYSGCGLSPADRTSSMNAIRRFIDTREPRSAPILQFGGLAVSRTARRSVLAIGMCLAATAFTRTVGSAGGVLFAAEKCRTEALYRMAGAFPLGDSVTLPPLVDTFHRDRVLLMGTAPFGNVPELEDVVRHFEDRLRPAYFSTIPRSAALPS